MNQVITLAGGLQITIDESMDGEITLTLHARAGSGDVLHVETDHESRHQLRLLINTNMRRRLSTWNREEQ